MDIIFTYPIDEAGYCGLVVLILQSRGTRPLNRVIDLVHIMDL